ncbi:MAG: hypothetical protein IH991_04915 [Planctomycetes bacterium]|nr:hypothetical protein [Planctomycetota bacterium]
MEGLIGILGITFILSLPVAALGYVFLAVIASKVRESVVKPTHGGTSAVGRPVPIAKRS